MTTKSESVTYLTKDLLEIINTRAIAKKRNRALNPEAIKRLPDKKFPVVFSMVHNDVEIRAGIVLNERGTVAFLDMSFEDFNALPKAEVVISMIDAETADVVITKDEH